MMQSDVLSPTSLPIPRQDERCAFIGQSGSGKTELMKALLSAKPNFHLVDTKLASAYKNGGGIGEEVSGSSIYKSHYLGPGQFVWHTPDTFNIEYNPDEVEEYFNTVYQIGNRVIGLDETLDVATSSSIPFSLNRVITRGRERGIGLWAGMQRPAGVPPTARTEAQHKYLFYVEEPDDQERMEAAFGGQYIPWDYLLANKHSFLYRDERGTIHGPFKLQLEER